MRRRFGVTEAPIRATHAFRRMVSTLCQNGIRVERWVLVNELEGTVTRVTTYNDEAGSHFDAVKNTSPIGRPGLIVRLEDYQAVPVWACAVAVMVGETSLSEAPLAGEN